MDSSKIQQQAINLGNLLVDELKRDSEYPDVLSRWMAHYIAEQIHTAKSSTGTDKTVAEEKCFQAILALWKHRSSITRGYRPLENFEPILRTLQRLTPEAPQSFYHHLTDARKGPQDPISVEDLMEFVVRTDEAARVLIDAALAEATRKAKDEKTIALLKEAVSEEPVQDTTVIQFLVDSLSLEESIEDRERKLLRKRLTDRLQKLDSFCKVAKNMCEQLKQQLKALPKQEAS